jgi:hypothetical protein
MEVSGGQRRPGFQRRVPNNLQNGEAVVANDDSNLRPARAQLAEPPYADPPARSCGRGEQVTAPPIPISTSAHLGAEFRPGSVGPNPTHLPSRVVDSTRPIFTGFTATRKQA